MLRALAPFAVLAVVTVVACSASPTEDPSTGSGGSDGTGTSAGAGGSAGGGTPWGTRTDVEAIFAKDCSGCHADEWTSCWNVHESAEAIESAIATGDMPRGSTMAASDKATVLAWLQAGAPCEGPEPDGGATTTGTGGPPIGEGDYAAP
jgi:hypothetical protein